MTKATDQLLILSDFNTGILAGLFANDAAAPSVEVRTAGFGSVIPALLNIEDAGTLDRETIFIWARPESISETFSRARRMEAVDPDAIFKEVDAFCDAVTVAGSRTSTILIASWHLPGEFRGYGILDWRQNTGVRSLLSRMNDRLANRLSDQPGVFVLDSTRWFECKEPLATKMWYLAKVPYTNEVFKSAVGEVKAAIRTVKGESRKVVICDLDDTLWGGVVGEIGWQNLRLGGHDAIGEAFADLQQELKSLTRRGIILAVVSKNTEHVALEAIERHPEMILRRDDFANWRIDWNDKAQNIVDLMRELNLGLESAVFLDDNPVERSRVACALPAVFVPELPADKTLYAATLRRLDCFDVAVVSEEDRTRTTMYHAERERRAAISGKQCSVSMDEWLDTLNIRVEAEPINQANIKRSAQLFNKTNQMNLSTRRMTEAQLIEWEDDPHRVLWTFRIGDKFGDSGLTAIAGLEVHDGVARITDYLLSCRVMGRRIEEAIVHQLADSARSLDARTLRAVYQPTERNRPCLEFWLRSGFVDQGNHQFEWNLSQPYPLPRAVNLVVVEAN